MERGRIVVDRSDTDTGDAVAEDAAVQVEETLDPVAAAFNAAFYLRTNPDVAASAVDPFDHYIKYGWTEGRAPRGDFDVGYYTAHNRRQIGDEHPFRHWVLKGRDEGLRGHPWNDDPDVCVIEVMREAFDLEFYQTANSDLADSGKDLFNHFLLQGWKEGRDPNAEFSPHEYLELHPELAVGVNPFSHYLLVGRAEGRPGRRPEREFAPLQLGEGFDLLTYAMVEEALDPVFYLRQFGAGADQPDDPVLHYITTGWRDGLDPNDWFSTSGYLRAYPDVFRAGANPLAHYLQQGRAEGRQTRFAEGAPAAALAPSGGPSSAVYDAHRNFVAPADVSEDLDRRIVRLRPPRVKVLAYYLPQFHPIPENDSWWGTGFTEWRNVVRGLPRFNGHYQPRIPKDLGFYDLRDIEVMRRQADLAKAGGVHGFCFYYYSFNGRRILEKPIEMLLNTPDLEMPFCLMWANENWTRTWDGFESNVLMRQDYREDDETELLADWARHFADPRYVRIGDRPLLFIYRPGIIPDCTARVTRWRERLQAEFGVNPLMMMAQGFNDTDPRLFGLDGAIEFPPHKVAAGLPGMNGQLSKLDPDFSGHVIDYNQVIERSLTEATPDYPLIKAATPSWDNEARRPGRGMVLHGSTPDKYERWMRALVDHAVRNPVFGDAIVGVNAWNEWAEGAYLEPDVHYGSAYLNATARAVTGAAATAGRLRVVIVGHDAYLHGAQLLVRNIAQTLTERFGVEVHLLILGEGPLMETYRAIAPVTQVAPGDIHGLRLAAESLHASGYKYAIVNTTVSGWSVKTLDEAGIGVVSLVHELGTLLRERSLEANAREIATHARSVVFPAATVRDNFIEVSGPASASVVVRPQGLYKSAMIAARRSASTVRKTLGIPEDAKVVINVGYADARKGFDTFINVARRLCEIDKDVYFIWVGHGEDYAVCWQLPDAVAGDMEGRFFFTGHVAKVVEYYAAADVFFLSSREDPFPSVVLEALAAGLPIVGLEGCGGCDDLIDVYGRLVSRSDINGMVEALQHFLGQSAKVRDRAAETRRDIVRNEFRFGDYCFDLLKLSLPGLARVTAVVPNYNYARYMPDRLGSVFRQTYPVFETLVLDDVSTDDSVAVIRRYAEEVRREVDLVVNETNSGSVFRQWRRGAELARGDYVWIAEADDTADEAFLETLAKCLDESGAAFAFSDSWQIGTDDERLGDSYRPYMNEIEPGAFDVDFVMEGDDFLKRFLSVKNVILNVSGVLWRRDALLAALEGVGDSLLDFRVAGDWRLYGEVCRTGGKVAYVARALNGHRRHQTSVTHALAKQTHYDEILAMQKFASDQLTLEPGQLAARAAHRAAVRQVLGVETEDSEPSGAKKAAARSAGTKFA